MARCGVWIITGVPASQRNTVRAEFNLDGPQSVTAVQQTDGTYIITATFAPCPDGSNPTSQKAFGP
jgi:hypothetical protein